MLFNSMSLATHYQKKTDKHILDNLDTHIGSVENVDANMWIYDKTVEKIILNQIEYITGICKLFDEGIVNCRDHAIRMLTKQDDVNSKCVSYIETAISEDGRITFENNGNGIDLVIHPEYNGFRTS